MIILPESDVKSKGEGLLPNSARPPPPPVHPSIQYGAASSVIPPKYETTSRPTLSTIIYTFSQVSDRGAMVLHAPQSGVSYYISVAPNCFTPTSHITTIHKSSLDGETIGDFEIGPSTAKINNTVCIRGNEYSITEVLSFANKLFSGSSPIVGKFHISGSQEWIWKPIAIPNNVQDKPEMMVWDEVAPGGPLNCFSSKQRTQANLLAKFTPRAHMRRQGFPAQQSRLEVTPLGHNYFEDILFAALIVERMRSAPPSVL